MAGLQPELESNHTLTDSDVRSHGGLKKARGRLYQSHHHTLSIFLIRDHLPFGHSRQFITSGAPCDFLSQMGNEVGGASDAVRLGCLGFQDMTVGGLSVLGRGYELLDYM